MATLTINHYINQANSFITSIRDTKNSYYVFAGRSVGWENDVSPPSANASIAQIEQTVYNDLLFGKIISNSDVSFLISRYNWANNTYYDAYDHNDDNLFSKNFYIMTNQYQVFKCLFNNSGANSTIQPTLNTTRGTFKTGDGYVWKYMYTVDPAANTKFTSTNYIPVATNTYVSSNATPGSVDVIKIIAGGNNYQIYETGFINRVVDKFTIQLPSTSSANSNHYAKSSIYLKAGFGAGQIREIQTSNGASKQIRVNPSTPFEIYNRLDFANTPVGTIVNGYTAEQKYDYVSYLFTANGAYFNPGANVVQTDTGVAGTILSANATTILINRFNYATTFSQDLAIRDLSQDGTVKLGNVNIIANTNTVVANNSTNFVSDYAINDYIRVGASANNNIRRITAVNSSIIVVDKAFTSTLTNVTHFKVPVVATVSSIVASAANGVVSNTNLTSQKLTISNNLIEGIKFIIGEKVNLVNSANTNQGANAIVAFSNSSTLYLADVVGSWSNLYIRGESSLQRSSIITIDSNPNITVANSQGVWLLGQPVIFSFNGANTGNVSLAAAISLPGDQTEYLIGPTINVDGDGSNAYAIGIVNNQFGSANNVIGAEMINPGSNYTYANVTIYANTQYGSGALAASIISPIFGHGYDAVFELGGRYVGVSSTFDTGTNESFFFPTYGTFRKAGILQNPQYADVRVTLTNFDRSNFNLINKVTSNANTSIINWIPGETVYQTTSNSSLVINYSSPVGTFKIGDIVRDSATPTVNGAVTFANNTAVIVTLSNTLPAAHTAIFNANSQVIGAAANTSNNTIILGANAVLLTANNLVTYKALTGNTVVVGLANNGQYYIQFSNSTHIALKSSVASNTRIELTPSLKSETGHNFIANYLIGNLLYSAGAPANAVAASGTVTAAYPIIPLTNVSAAGIVAYGNATFLQLKGVTGKFTQNSAFNGIVGVYSNTTAFITATNTVYFEVTSDSNTEIISETTSGATGEVTYLISNSEVILSNVVGKFVAGDIMVDSTINAHATVSTIYTANGSRDVTHSFGNKFNQTLRITTTSYEGAFTNNEIVQQDITYANGRIVSTSNDLDIAMNTLLGSTFTINQSAVDGLSGANGIVTFANTTYIKLTSVSQDRSFVVGHAINSGSSNAVIAEIFPVLLINDVSGANRFQAQPNNIVGQTSGATGQCNNYNLITYPELIRDTGKVIYIENFSPITRSKSTKEEIKLVIKF